MAAISGLTVYPIKSCKGISCERAKIWSTGFAFDRRWVIVQDKNGKFETQRKDPKMALIETAIPPEALLGSPGDSLAHLTLQVPGQEELEVPLQSNGSLKSRICNVWEWTGEALDEGDLAAEYLSNFMGHKVRLLKYAGDPGQGSPESNSSRRALDPNFAPIGTETAFTDKMPFLIANEASLAELNSRCPETIPMNRFRPNIVVKGAEEWEEDTWKQLRLGDCDFTASSPNGRCVVTTTNQTTATRSASLEPLKTLGGYRKGSLLGWDADPSWKNLVFFGWYFLAAQQGVLYVGDKVEVGARRIGPPQQWGPP